MSEQVVAELNVVFVLRLLKLLDLSTGTSMADSSGTPRATGNVGEGMRFVEGVITVDEAGGELG